MSIVKLLRYNSTILGCRGEIEECTQWLEENHGQLSGADDAIDALAESALLLADEARRLAAIARKRGHRAHLSTVTEED